MSRRLETLLFLLPLTACAVAVGLLIAEASPFGGGPSRVAPMAPFGDVARAPNAETADLE